MKVKKIALACGLAMLGMSVQSFAEISMNIGATSNYIWRGVTQTDDGAAISGGIDWSHDSGFYVGNWVSNVDFGPGTSPYEHDIYGGYSGEISDFGYDVGLIYYMYDSDDDANFLEAALSGSWKFLSAGVNYTLDGDADDDTSAFVDGDIYYYGGASYDLPEDFSVSLTVGRYSFENNDEPGVTSYNNVLLSLSKSAGDYGDVTLSVSDTDLDDADDPNEDDDMRFSVSWSKTF